jgi:basic membrane lipoprotein Med (substrate-binding protein (PBP1-ABC) superfamily)
VTDSRIGTIIAGYRIESLLGRGGMSVVYLAEQEFPLRKVALKLLAPELAEDDAFRERFIRESNAAASIDDPNIVPIYGAGEVDGVLYIAMRYVEGTDLRKLLDQEGPLDPLRAVSIVSQAAGALDTAHARGLVHRDVKPGNILLAARPAGSGPLDHVYVADFGLIKRRETERDLTRTGQIMGSVDYIAPEQIEGRPVDGRADVYSLGCVLYECLTGEPPFRGQVEAAVMYAHLKEKPPRPSDKRPELPAGIDDVLARAMAKSPDDRYPACGELAAAARAELGGAEAGAPSSLPHPRRRHRLKRALVAGGVAAAVGTAASAVALTWGGGGGRPPTGEASRPVTACQLTFGHLNDRTFNQAIYDGLTRAVTDLGISVRARESGSKEEDRTTLQAFMDRRCSLIVTVIQAQEGVVAAAKANPEQKFLIVDPFEPPSLPNILGVVFRVEQAAFLAGYVAADTTKTGAVATFGGLPIPTVIPYMDGFAAGVLKYNEDNGTDVRLLGWDPGDGTGSFISQSDFAAFANQARGKQIAHGLISRGADVLFPVAGSAGLGADQAAREAGNVLLVGVDFDEFFQAPQFADLWLTSVRKRFDVAVEDVMKLVVDGTFKGGGLFPGTLANGSVDIAPFHDLDGRVPAALRDRLDQLEAGIIDGSISVDPRDYL